MAIPYYVSPEQMMQDKAEYAKKGISKGRSIVVLSFVDGVLMVADNPSTLSKISEIYDNIAFSGAGKYSEFENLRKAGIRHADLKGYMYSREDVTAKSLVNAYSQTLGTIFSQEVKPFEVEIAVVSVGENDRESEIYRISFDGSIFDERGFTAIGGRSESIMSFLKDRYRNNISLRESLELCVSALQSTTSQKFDPQNLEVAVLDQNRHGRKFRKLMEEEVRGFLSASD